MTGMEALRGVLIRMRSERQDGYNCYSGEGNWHFSSTGLSVYPEELNALFDMAGITPDEIQSLGKCKDCIHSLNGRERGYDMPCCKCLRPKHDLFELNVPSVTKK